MLPEISVSLINKKDGMVLIFFTEVKEKLMLQSLEFNLSQSNSNPKLFSCQDVIIIFQLKIFQKMLLLFILVVLETKELSLLMLFYLLQHLHKLQGLLVRFYFIIVNTEGRVQISSKVVQPPGHSRDAWEIFRALSEECGATLPYNSIQ